ncbi:MAG: M16 family metallopeptidase [Phycisphaerales bacterium]
MTTSFQTHTLANGLTVIAEIDPEAHSAAAGFFVKTGARDEPTNLMGVSHFLEHMIFKGTESMSAEVLNRRFDELGARNNAYTSHELTCYYASVIPEAGGEAIDLIGHMMRPALRPADFETEKGVILEEIAMYEDNPFWVLYERTSERHYGTHPLGHRVLGTRESIEALTRDQMASYFERRYAADATTVALAGRVDFDDACRRIEAACGGWPAQHEPTLRTPPERGDARLELDDDRFGRGYLLLLAAGPAAQDDRRYAASLAAQILGASDNSRLHWALIEDGLAEEAVASYEPNDLSGEMLVYASGDPGRLDEIEGVIDREITGLADSLREDDLARLRSKFATSFTVSSERPGDRMQRLGRRWVMLGDYRTLEEELERIRAVDLNAVRELLAAFPMSPRTVGRLRPPSSV